MSQIISIVVSKISDNVECILYGENWCFCPKIVDFDVSKIAMWNDLSIALVVLVLIEVEFSFAVWLNQSLLEQFW